MFKKSKNKKATPTVEPTKPIKTTDKFIFKGTTDILSAEEIKNGQGGYHLIAPFTKISDKWDYDKLLRHWDSDFCSHTVNGYDNTWELVVHDKDIPNEERGARLLVNKTLPNGRIDLSEYIGREKEYIDKIVKVYDVLLEDVKKYNEVLNKHNDNDDNNDDNDEPLSPDFENYLLEENGINDYSYFSWTFEDLGITHIQPSTYSDGKRKSDDIRMTFVESLSDKDRILDRNLNPFKPSSLGEFNAALNEYYSDMRDLKVLAAVHKWFQSQIHHIEEENALFKDVFNIE